MKGYQQSATSKKRNERIGNRVVYSSSVSVGGRARATCGWPTGGGGAARVGRSAAA